MNRLHPIFHGHAYQIGSRIDIERMLPVDLDEEDCDFLIEDYSEPPRFVERVSPVSTQVGGETVRGRNWTELMARTLRVLSRVFTQITIRVHQTIQVKFKQRGMLPFLSLDFDADAIHRLIEMDLETNENTYGRLVDLFVKGVLAPVITVPFHVILPTLKNDAYVRLLVRIALDFNWPLLKRYHHYLRKVHGERHFVATFWLPEGGYSQRALEIVHDEFVKKAKEEKIGSPHLVFLLDNFQTLDRDSDVLMKSWNVARCGNGKNDFCTIVFRDGNFSDWVTYSKPSVKKLIDRTIAKVDAGLNEQEVDYGWAHFEDILSLCYSHRAAQNFEQKLIKLTELGYMSVAPDVFARRKLSKEFGRAKHEPHQVELRDNTAWCDWHKGNQNFGRWLGLLDSNAEPPIVDEDHPFFRQTEKGPVEEKGPQCWKIALTKTIDRLTDLALGNSKKMTGGMLGVLMKLTGVSSKTKAAANVWDFIVRYARVNWREHYLHYDDSEADLNLRVFCDEVLCRDSKRMLSDEEVIVAGAAAQTFYLTLHAHKSFAFAPENFDQRAVYQSVVMLAVGICNACYVHHWQGRRKETDALVSEYLEYLVDFENGYQRFSLADYGVKEAEWQDAIKSYINESPLNVVARAARRIAARHLRPLGYKKEFLKEDETLPSSVGHIWSAEIAQSNFEWDNPLFCGVVEE